MILGRYGDGGGQITEEIMDAAAQKEETERLGMLRLIFSRFEGRAQIPEGLMIRMIASHSDDLKTLKRFLREHKGQVPITTEVLEAAIKRGNPDIVGFLISMSAKPVEGLVIDDETMVETLLIYRQLGRDIVGVVLSLFSAQHEDGDGLAAMLRVLDEVGKRGEQGEDVIKILRVSGGELIW